jgi:hypothetical protein
MAHGITPLTHHVRLLGYIMGMIYVYLHNKKLPKKRFFKLFDDGWNSTVVS